jgi:hypothetical protein
MPLVVHRQIGALLRPVLWGRSGPKRRVDHLRSRLEYILLLEYPELSRGGAYHSVYFALRPDASADALSLLVAAYQILRPHADRIGGRYRRVVKELSACLSKNGVAL